AEEPEALEELDDRAVGVVQGVRAELEPEAVVLGVGVHAAAGAPGGVDDVHAASGARRVVGERQSRETAAEDEDVVSGHGWNVTRWPGDLPSCSTSWSSAPGWPAWRRRGGCTSAGWRSRCSRPAAGSAGAWPPCGRRAGASPSRPAPSSCTRI